VDRLAGSDFDVRVFRADDLGGLAGRAAGGLPVQQFKVTCILRAIDEGPEGTRFVWSDVDVQPLGSTARLRAHVEAGSATVRAQREFDDCGLNVGFLVVERSPEARALFADLGRRMTETKALDQKILNAMVLDGRPGVERFSTLVWASSNAAARPPLADLVLHHANFIPDDGRRRDSRDPTPKLRQLDDVAAWHDAGDDAKWTALLDDIVGDPSLAIYRDRSFPAALRDRWADLFADEDQAEEEEGGCVYYHDDAAAAAAW